MTLTFKVEGMSCNHCVMHVRNALEELDGVAKAEVSLEENQATVEYDQSKVNVGDMKEAVSEAGYKMVD